MSSCHSTTIDHFLNESKKESEYFQLRILAQIPYRNNPPVYFAVDKHLDDFNYIVVKGPIINENYLKNTIIVNDLKQLFQLVNPIKIFTVNAIPNIFISFGFDFIETIEPNKEYPFLVMEDIISTNNIPKILYPTKTSESIEVYDHNDIYQKTYQLSTQKILKLKLPENNERCLKFLATTLFRYVFGIKDNAFRNLIFNKELDEFYSIDEGEFGYDRKYLFDVRLKTVKLELSKNYNNIKSSLYYVIRDWIISWRNNKNIILNILNDDLNIYNLISKNIKHVFDRINNNTILDMV